MMLSDVCFNFPKQIFHFLIKGKCISTRQIIQLEYKDMELLGFPISFVAKRLTLIPSKLVITCRYENYQRNNSHKIIFYTLVRFDVMLIIRVYEMHQIRIFTRINSSTYEVCSLILEQETVDYFSQCFLAIILAIFFSCFYGGDMKINQSVNTHER